MNLIGLFLIAMYIVWVFLIVDTFYKKKIISLELSRKLIHIMMTNCWFLVHLFIDNIYFALFLPIVSILVNVYSNKNKLLKCIERNENDYGTIHYSLIFTFFVFLSYKNIIHYDYLTLGIMALGYGDAFASLIGNKFGKKELLKNKTLEGSIGFLLMTTFLNFIFLKDFQLAFSVALIASIIELLSFKMDNLIVPLFTTIISYFIFNYWNELIFIVLLNFLFAFITFKYSKLTLKASLIAFIMGTAIYYYSGFNFYFILVLFLLSSSLISMFKKENKHKVRDAKQVLVNGIIPFILGILFYRTNNQIYEILYFISIAGATADTWASEIGVLSMEKPIGIVTNKKMEKGLSGGITLLGTIASLLGSLLISIFYFKTSLYIGLIILFFGFLISLIDSIIGDLFQAKYQRQNKIIEEKTDKLVKGYFFVTNNFVNLVSVLIGILIAFVYLVFIF